MCVYTCMYIHVHVCIYTHRYMYMCVNTIKIPFYDDPYFKLEMRVPKFKFDGYFGMLMNVIE